MQYEFLKDKSINRGIESTLYNKKLGVYTNKDTQQSAGIFYSDSVIVPADRLKKAHWQLATGEKITVTKLRQPLVLWGVMINPLLMHYLARRLIAVK